jgi:protein-glutamine gamma-glutamyltransferase
MIRPAGVSKGGVALALGWMGMVMSAALTGSATGVIAAVPAVLGLLWSLLSGAVALVGTRITGFRIDDGSAGQPTTCRVELDHRMPVIVTVRHTDGAGWAADGRAEWHVVAPRRGRHRDVSVVLASAGRAGLVWWKVTATVPLDEPWTVGAMPVAPGAPIVDSGGAHNDGEPEDCADMREWADGDVAARVHWPSSVRHDTLIVRDAEVVGALRTVDVALLGDDPAAEAGRVVTTAQRLLAAGDRVRLRLGSTERALGDVADLRAWSAEFEADRDAPLRRAAWYRRQLGLPKVEPEHPVTALGHALVATAKASAALLLLGGLGTSMLGRIVACVAIGAVAVPAVTALRRPLRLMLGLAATAAVVATTVDFAGGVELHQLWRFALPQMLVALVTLHGYDTCDRRAARVALAFTAVIGCYGAGLRVDDALRWWCLLVGVTLTLAVWRLAAELRPRQHRRRATSTMRGAVPAAAIAVASITLLGIIPVPSGPSRLMLPTWVPDDAAPSPAPGQLIDPSGNPSQPAPQNGGQPAPSTGTFGGYPGFSETMDTSTRGEFGDDIVLRVRAPFPDFWRGQTFANFDGRSWSVLSELDMTRLYGRPGQLRNGPTIKLREPVAAEREMIYTVTAEVDLGNLVFVAANPTDLLIDSDVWQRPDGALRATSALPEGSVYTVVSSTVPVTEDLLRADGVVALSPDAFGPYLTTPPTTSQRTRQLARELAQGQPTTYDTVRAIEAWLADNVEYTLDAPVPPTGADAVDHFLFESRLGFCEQVASAMAIMLRTLGVPTRVATGYVPSERDDLAGTWISRESDAHAWVEVYFPSVGWQAFDPTASVPLRNQISRPSVLQDAWASVGSVARQVVRPALTLGAALLGAVAIVRVAQRVRHRRRRGRWGLLQDRFTRAAVARGAHDHLPNSELARHLGDELHPVARALDMAKFDPNWHDDDAAYDNARRVLDDALSTR